MKPGGIPWFQVLKKGQKMKTGIKAFFNLIDRISSKIGDGLSILIIVIMLFLTIEAMLRYVFNNPTIWVWPLSRQLFGVYILFAGIYAMSKGSHIKIEILYNLFPGKIKQFSALLALFSFICFVGVLIWQGTLMGLNSLSSFETANGAFRIPLYPLKLLIPLAAVLFFLEGIYVLLKIEKELPSSTDKQGN